MSLLHTLLDAALGIPPLCWILVVLVAVGAVRDHYTASANDDDDDWHIHTQI